MNQAFPADVSLRIDGQDYQAAQALVPVAKQVLFRALRQQDATGAVNVSQQVRLDDGSVVRVALAGNLKQVFITPAPRGRPQEPESPPVVEPPIPTTHVYSMYSGAVRPSGTALQPEVAVVSNPEPPPTTVPVLKQFHPDQVCASAYQLLLEWQEPQKLAVNDSGTQVAGTATSHYPKPSMYTGAMQRCVQAILGIGKQESETAGFISEELPSTYPYAYVYNQYSPSWLKTHGIYKAGDGSVWLVEISKDNGVLAMPLPIFSETDSYGFMAYLGTIGDTDSLNVILEFGGLPTGEPFPGGADLTTAIATGKVLQLLTAADVEPFYRDTVNAVDKNGPADMIGWAFSASGAKADNITFWYQDFDAAVVRSTWLSDGKAHAAPEVRFMSVQHWHIEITLTATPAEGFPYGTGSAAMTLVEQSYLPTTNVDLHSGSTFPELLAIDMFRIPTGNTEATSIFYIYGRVDNWAADSAIDPPPVFLFYVGETLEVVRYLPGGNVASFTGDSLSVPVPTGSTTACVGLMVPPFCREGYLLIASDGVPVPTPTPIPWNATFPITISGYFAAIGTVVFDSITEFFYSDWLFGSSYNMASWPALWLSQGNGAVSIAGPWGLKFGATFNCGPTGGYVMNNTVSAPYNRNFDYVGAGGLIERFPDNSTQQDPAISSLEIPADTAASAVNFVGSV